MAASGEGDPEDEHLPLAEADRSATLSGTVRPKLPHHVTTNDRGMMLENIPSNDALPPSRSSSSKTDLEKEYKEALENPEAAFWLDMIAECSTLRNSDDDELRQLGHTYFTRLWAAYLDTPTGRATHSAQVGEFVPIYVVLDHDGEMRVGVTAKANRIVPLDWQDSIRHVEGLALEARSVLDAKMGKLVVARCFNLAKRLVDLADQYTLSAATNESHQAELASRVESINRRREELAKQMARVVLQAELRAAQQAYLLGMVPGSAIVILVIWLLPRGDVLGISASLSLLAAGGGAIGAILSVLGRMTRARAADSMNVDYTIGRLLVALAGSFRPVVGLLLGFVFYLMMAAHIVPIRIPEDGSAGAFIAAIGFLAGFSERLAQDSLIRTGRSAMQGNAESERLLIEPTR
jgi:hypothetical protein